MLAINYKFKKCFQVFAVFSLIYFTSSYVAYSIRGYVSMGILMVISITLFLISLNRISFKLTYSFLVLLGLSFFSMIWNGENLYEYLILWGYTIIAYLFVISISFEKFTNYFIKIMLFLSVYSLITFAMSLISPALVRKLPQIINNQEEIAYNFIFSVVRPSSYVNRNYGIFWEPGAYQVFLLLALGIVLFSRKKYDKKTLYVFIITILSTLSTAAYFGLLLLFLIKIVDMIFERKLYLKHILYVFVMVILTIVIFNIVSPNIYFSLIGKLKVLIDDSLLDNPVYESATARYTGFIVAFEAIKISPVFGTGIEGLALLSIMLGNNILTVTPLNWIGTFGIIYGFIMIFGIWNFSKLIKTSHKINVALFGFIIIILSTQSLTRNAFIISIIFYGLSRVTQRSL